jgi:hypothetical protein
MSEVESQSAGVGGDDNCELVNQSDDVDHALLLGQLSARKPGPLPTNGIKIKNTIQSDWMASCIQWLRIGTSVRTSGKSTLQPPCRSSVSKHLLLPKMHA